MFPCIVRCICDMHRKGGKPKPFLSLLLVTALLLASLMIASGQQTSQEKREKLNRQLVLAVASLNVAQTRQCLRDGASPNVQVSLSLSMPPFKGPRLLYHYPVNNPYNRLPA